MSKVIDAFLFFQELDLLEVRLAYLDVYVDTFVIVEACQTFSGRAKPFVLEKNFDRYAKYHEKIRYYKLCDWHDGYESVERYLTEACSGTRRKVLDILREHKHYSKSALNWVLDSYHRESIHIPLAEVASTGDIVMVSDLDEFPSERIFHDGTLKSLGAKPRVCRQHEFRYFLNLYKDSDWCGSIIARYENIKDVSLNVLRMDSKNTRKIVEKDEIQNGGWHFTSCGNMESIRNKIQSWGHQEFNNERILKRLEYHVRTGQDIFEREQGTILTKLSIESTRLFDDNLKAIIQRFPELILKDEVLHVEHNVLHRWIQKGTKLVEKLRRIFSI